MDRQTTGWSDPQRRGDEWLNAGLERNLPRAVTAVLGTKILLFLWMAAFLLGGQLN